MILYLTTLNEICDKTFYFQQNIFVFGLRDYNASANNLPFSEFQNVPYVDTLIILSEFLDTLNEIKFSRE